MELTDEEQMKTLKAALLIQRWYRRYCARLEVRRRYTWTIFQSIEYQGEQDQIKLHNFFNAMLRHVEVDSASRVVAALSPRNSTIMAPSEDGVSGASLPLGAALEDIPVENSYRGPRLNFPLTVDDIHRLVAAFKKKKALHVRYVCMILKEAALELAKRPTVNTVSSSFSGQVTICGDLHGKLDDLLTILYKNGLPSNENPYVFNGDFVDRGKRSIEVLLLLLALLLVWPGQVYLNRGNHEDLVMNARYGFCKEIGKKFKGSHTARVMGLVEEVYRHLPIATVVNKTAFVVHGGISDGIDLNRLITIDRSKYVSVLRMPILEEAESLTVSDLKMDDILGDGPVGTMVTEVEEWKMILDLLWSDPQSSIGCEPNTFRGGGAYFGPDVTEEFLKSNGLQYLIRSHECKRDGYETTHDGKCVTVFSASNYYEEGSNRGAYMKLQGNPPQPIYVQYTADTKHKSITLRERVGRLEISAINELRCQILGSRSALMKGFKEADPDSTGLITISQWVSVMDQCNDLKLPWRTLREKLVDSDDSGLIVYKSTFTKNSTGAQEGPSVVETLYRHKNSLEAIFRLLDKDNSGFITPDEFRDACAVLERHLSIPSDQVADLAASLDINKDGKIDFNEFLECFRIVESGLSNQDEEDDDSFDEDD